MPTLEEAIGIFEQLSKLCETNGIHDSQELYKQYAAWLRELQKRRKAPEIITCGECAYRKIRGVDGFCDHITGEEIMVRKTDYCKWAERRTNENNNLYA